MEHLTCLACIDSCMRCAANPPEQRRTTRSSARCPPQRTVSTDNEPANCIHSCTLLLMPTVQPPHPSLHGDHA